MNSNLPNPDDRWAWKLRLFVSVDVVNSTRYKSAFIHSDESPTWIKTFEDFFRDFPRELKEAYSTLPDVGLHGYSHPDKTLEAWKFLGDEILFHVQLNRHEEVASHLMAVKQLLTEYPDRHWKDKNPLRLKSFAWLAGFPITNTEIKIDHPDGRIVQDFIGPAIDAGFRLGKFADTKKLVVSPELALMLLDATHRLHWNNFKLVFLAREVLKGVADNNPYPVIYIHLNDGKPDHEELLLGQEPIIRHDVLLEYLRDLRKTDKSFQKLFIEGDPDDAYKEIPEDSRRRMTQLKVIEQSSSYDPSQDTDSSPNLSSTTDLTSPTLPDTAAISEPT